MLDRHALRVVLILALVVTEAVSMPTSDVITPDILQSGDTVQTTPQTATTAELAGGTGEESRKDSTHVVNDSAFAFTSASQEEQAETTLSPADTAVDSQMQQHLNSVLEKLKLNMPSPENLRTALVNAGNGVSASETTSSQRTAFRVLMFLGVLGGLGLPLYLDIMYEFISPRSSRGLVELSRIGQFTHNIGGYAVIALGLTIAYLSSPDSSETTDTVLGLVSIMFIGVYFVTLILSSRSDFRRPPVGLLGLLYELVFATPTHLVAPAFINKWARGKVNK